jgi:4-amino-4-deoxy-L-arabinose transferase-like glycosyltransferase
MSTLQQSASPGLKALRPTLTEAAIALTVFVIGAVLLWISAPHHGEFWWSDSPRHALNGVFVKDLIAAFSWRDPTGFAAQYYVQYPALTILFYPPLFYLLSAPFFAIFGVSHATALSVVILHYIALALGLYVLARRWLSFPIALAVGLSAMAVPDIALWGRQVMLEIPAMAFAVWAFVFLRRYGDEARPVFLYCGAFLLLCAIYTKFSAIFLVPVMGLMLFVTQGNGVWRNRHIWISAALFIIGFIPVALLTLKFGQANVQSITGIADAEVSRTSIAGWLWYAKKLPEQLGGPILIGALLGGGAMWLRRRELNWIDFTLLFGWLAIGYLFFSAIDLKESRHSTLILPPLLIMAGFAADRLLPARLSSYVALLLVVGTGVYTLRYSPVPAVEGYREAADWIAKNAPKNAVILFSGKRDGSFIFNMRTHGERRDLYIVRADKLLLEVAVRRELGVGQKQYSTQQIGEMLDRYGVQYVVAQTDFWTDLEVMANLQNLLQSDHFEAVTTIPVTANVPTEDKELRIYRNTHPIDAKRPEIELDLPIIGRSVEGHVGSQP